MRQVNMLPEELKRAEKRRPIRNSLILTVGLASLVILPMHLLLAGRVSRLEKTANQQSAVREMPEITQLHKKITQIKVERQGFIDKNKVLMDILSKQLPHSYILKIIGDITFDRVWLIGLSIDNQKGICKIEGISFNNKLVSEFMLELKKLPYFESIDLTSMEKGSEAGKETVDFKIICEFK